MESRPKTSAQDAPPSRWARALAGDAAAARELAGSYWYPAYAFLRASGLVAGEAPARVESALAALENPRNSPGTALVLRERLLECARGALVAKELLAASLAIDRAWAEARFAKEPPAEPEALFLRRWALTVLEFALGALGQEYAARGQAVLFQQLQPFLGYGKTGDEAYEALARELSVSVSGARKTVYDLRTRYRAILRAQIAQTVASEEQIDPEMTALLCAL